MTKQHEHGIESTAQVAALLAVTIWLGGTLVYAYHLGAMDTPPAGEEPRHAAHAGAHASNPEHRR